jgi:hypothetical protein
MGQLALEIVQSSLDLGNVRAGEREDEFVLVASHVGPDPGGRGGHGTGEVVGKNGWLGTGGVAAGVMDEAGRGPGDGSYGG